MRTINRALVALLISGNAWAAEPAAAPPTSAPARAPSASPPSASPPAARPARPRRPPVKSPEIAADGMVTFRLFAPDAREVKVAGDAIPKAVPLTKDPDGVWSVAIGPVPAGMWGYGFRVDGLGIADPVNAWVQPSRYPTNSLLHIPGKPPLDWDPQGNPAGTVHMHVYDSKAMGVRRPLRVYTPPGYEHGRGRYPVLYLFHGFSDNQDTWSVYGHAHVIADNLLAAKQAVPMIIVMTDGHTVPLEFGRMHENVVNFHKDVLESVIPFVEGLYRIKKTAADRAVIGLSMGGEHALTLGTSHPELFAWVGGMSSGARDVTFYEYALANPAVLNKKLRLLWMAIGKDDSMAGDNRILEAMFTDKGIKHEYKETEGAHTWPVWRGYLVEFLPRIFQARKGSK